MKALFVRKLYLWPRFEAHVKDALNDLPIEVCCSRSCQPYATILRISTQHFTAKHIPCCIKFMINERL